MIITETIVMLARPAPASAECIPQSESLWHAVKAGIAHTDLGLTVATLVLVYTTWQLIEDRRKAAIHARVSRIIHPIKSRHLHAERDMDIDGTHKHTHTEIDIDTHPRMEAA